MPHAQDEGDALLNLSSSAFHVQESGLVTNAKTFVHHLPAGGPGLNKGHNAEWYLDKANLLKWQLIELALVWMPWIDLQTRRADRERKKVKETELDRSLLTEKGARRTGPWRVPWAP